MSRPRMPAGLGARSKGGRLWTAVVSVYGFRVDELVVLEDACRHINLTAKMQAVVSRSPLLVKGSKGQQAPHPLLQELRASRLLVKQLLAHLGLPDEPEHAAQKEHAASWAARRAARQRWSHEAT